MGENSERGVGIIKGLENGIMEKKIKELESREENVDGTLGLYVNIVLWIRKKKCLRLRIFQCFLGASIVKY